MNGLPSNGNGPSAAVAEAIPTDQLRKILEGVTRTSKVIAGAQAGVFEVDIDDIENFFHLIDHRVNEQSSCSIERFEANIYLSDGTSRKLPSVQDFRSYATPNNATPTVVSLSMVLLIGFGKSDVPERQEVDITIRASDVAHEAIEVSDGDGSFRFASDKVQIAFEPKDNSLGLISYTINHTRISWGLDIENHLRSHIQKLMKRPTKFEKFASKISGPLNLFTTVFVGLYLVSLLIDLFFFFLFRSEEDTKGANITDLAAGYIINGHIAKYIVASLVVGVVVMVIFSNLVSRLLSSLRKPRPSFIMLSKHDEKKRSEKLKLHERRWTRLAVIALMNVATAIMIAVAEDRASNFVDRLFQGDPGAVSDQTNQ